MRKSSSGWSTGRAFKRGTGTGTVTVLETKVHRSSARNAKLAFSITAFIVGVLTATVANDRMHPILALLFGALIGCAAGAVVWVLVRVWPVIRLIWWWLPEIMFGLAIVYGWTALARHTPEWVQIAVAFTILGLPCFRIVRSTVIAWSWCLIVRHRLRTCFAQFISANKSGTLPLILIARPTPVGERIWIYLRPGLSLPDLQTRLDKLAVGCHAAAVTTEPASTRNAAYVRIDVKRREVLSATIGSQLTSLTDPGLTVPVPTAAALVPTALDLPDIPRTPLKPVPNPAPPAPRSANGHKPAPATTPAADDGDDLNQWI